MLNRFPLLKTVIAVVGGNLTYFLIRTWLPEPLQHRPFRLDWGVATDFWLCLVLWGILDLLQGTLKRNRGTRS